MLAMLDRLIRGVEWGPNLYKLKQNKRDNFASTHTEKCNAAKFQFFESFFPPSAQEI